MKKSTRLAWMVAALLSVGATCAYAHEDDAAPRSGKPEKLGDVSFPVSCNAAAQKELGGHGGADARAPIFHGLQHEPS